VLRAATLERAHEEPTPDRLHVRRRVKFKVGESVPPRSSDARLAAARVRLDGDDGRHLHA
jgi:hypothetical protein